MHEVHVSASEHIQLWGLLRYPGEVRVNQGKYRKHENLHARRALAAEGVRYVWYLLSHPYSGLQLILLQLITAPLLRE